jgi:hypothetical protein
MALQVVLSPNLLQVLKKTKNILQSTLLLSKSRFPPKTSKIWSKNHHSYFMVLVISRATSRSGKGLNHDLNQQLPLLIRSQQTQIILKAIFIFSMQQLSHLEFRLRTLCMSITSVCWILATCCFHYCVLMPEWSISQVLKVNSWGFQEGCLERSCQVHLLLRKSWLISWNNLSS